VFYNECLWCAGIPIPTSLNGWSCRPISILLLSSTTYCYYYYYYYYLWDVTNAVSHSCSSLRIIIIHDCDCDVMWYRENSENGIWVLMWFGSRFNSTWIWWWVMICRKDTWTSYLLCLYNTIWYFHVLFLITSNLQSCGFRRNSPMLTIIIRRFFLKPFAC